MNRATDWLRQAERDLAAARHAASAGFHEWAAFGAQQAGEKALKGLVEHLRGSLRGHSLTAILQVLAQSLSFPQTIEEAGRELDQVYVTSRYPNGFASGAPADYFSAQTSERLLRHAQAILEFCRNYVSRPGQSSG